MLSERFVCHRPLNGAAMWLTRRGLAISAGTLTGGLTRLAPLFEPLARVVLDRQDRLPVRYADETGWRMWSGGGSCTVSWLPTDQCVSENDSQHRPHCILVDCMFVHVQ